MGVYLGDNGRIMLRRKGSTSAFFTRLQGSDVNVERRRFSVDGAHEQFINGDRIEIATLPEVDDIPLTLVPGNVDPDGNIQSSFAAYVHVDSVGGIRLYTKLADAINGFTAEAIELGDIAAPGLDVAIEVISQDTSNCLGLVQEFKVTTARENVDTTCLSEHFKHSYENGLIQGQGEISCFWDYPQDCENLQVGSNEFGSYLAKLCIRLVQGASFHGFFYLFYDPSSDSKSVWYECENCIVNNVAITVTPDQLVQAQITFVTSGQIDLRQGSLPNYLMLEQTPDRILNEDGRPILLQNSEG